MLGRREEQFVNEEADFAEQFIASVINTAAIPSTSGQNKGAARMSKTSNFGQ